ncbi:hypothetical protein [Cryobacterium arcticum]|uniref:hypothetical protein n=1 Tax=Cryobacterium arcticum TaxID=670052 RepID=UPI0015E86CC6|nr:hypothetical protein [Cryobacterium arcticum]
MLGLSFEKLIVVALIAVFVIGPDRLPLYAGRLATLVRTLRDRSEAAQVRVTQELGEGFDVAEWKQLDPRQYDPRRIIREALAEPDPPAQPGPAAPAAAGAPAQAESSIAQLMRTSRTRLSEAEVQQTTTVITAPVDAAPIGAAPLDTARPAPSWRGYRQALPGSDVPA